MTKEPRFYYMWVTKSGTAMCSKNEPTEEDDARNILHICLAVDAIDLMQSHESALKEIERWKDLYINARSSGFLEGQEESAEDIEKLKAELEKIQSKETNSIDGLCTICGKPMPEGEEMFQYHGSSGPCPKDEND